MKAKVVNTVNQYIEDGYEINLDKDCENYQITHITTKKVEGCMKRSEKVVGIFPRIENHYGDDEIKTIDDLVQTVLGLFPQLRNKEIFVDSSLQVFFS